MTATAPPSSSGQVPRLTRPVTSSAKLAAAITIPITTRTSDQRDSGRQRTSGGTSKLTCTSPSSICSSVAIRPVTPRSRSTVERSTARGVEAGCVRSSSTISSRSTTASRNRSNRSRAASRSALSRSAWRAFSSIDRRSASAVSASVRRSLATASASRSRSSRASASSPACSRAPASVTASSATFSRPGFLAPRVWSSCSARSSFFLARLVPRSAPLIDACSRSRRAPSSRCRPASSWWRTEAVERKKPSVGTPESAASSLVGARRVGDDLPVELQPDLALGAAEGLGQPALVDAPVLILVGERHRDRRPSPRDRRPTAPGRPGRKPSWSRGE